MDDQLRFRYHRVGEQLDNSIPMSSEVNRNIVLQSQLDVLTAANLESELKRGDEISLLPASDAKSDDSSECETKEPGDYDPDDECPQVPRYCTGCSVTRVLMSPMVLLVLGLVGMTYYAYMFQTATLTTAELLLFNLVIAMLLGSYFQCLLLDPGTVPRRWHDAIKGLPHRVQYKARAPLVMMVA